MTVTVRVRPPSATACTQHTGARTVAAARKMSVSAWGPLGGGGRGGARGQPALQPWPLASPFADFDWVWDDLNKSSATLLSCDNRKVNFHTEYSCGTAAIRGTKELGEGQHFWEIKMTSPVYGTDMVSSWGAGGRSASTAQARPPPPQLAGLGRPLTPCARPALPRWWALGHQTWIWTSIITHSAACSAGTRTAGASPIRVRGALRPVGRAGGRGGMAHPSAPSPPPQGSSTTRATR